MSGIQTLLLGGTVSQQDDPYFNQVTLLLPGNGTNGAQNNTFLDGSTNNFTITRNGNTTQGTFTPFSVSAGNWSNYFDGNGDYLSAAANAAFNFGSGDFTIEGWIYLNVSPSSMPLVSWSTGTFKTIRFNTNGINIETPNPSNLSFTVSFPTGSTLTAGQWFHFALVRSSLNYTAYLNGIGGSAYTSHSGTIGNSTDALNIGYKSDAVFNGYISNLRIVKGTAVYSSNFTPPTSSLTAISNTSLLTCQSNRFVDNSTNAFAITRNGDVSVTAFSPFAPTAAYSASTNGGSGYFDGTGDYLEAPDNNTYAFSGDFTIEAWVYPQTSSTRRAIVTQWPGVSATNCAFLFEINASNRLSLAYGIGSSNPTVAATSTTVTANQWNHVAVTRSGTTVRLFVNGVLDSNAPTVSGTINNSTANVEIGRAQDGGFNFNGYITDVRILNGTAQYTAAFTPPTAPLTAVTNTSLLLNFTNAGIIDNSGKNDLETVGNAQIDTSVSKFGGGSMKFDGTGDWLTLPDSPDLKLGTGTFTIELWVYLASGDTGSARGLVGKGGASTGWLVSLDTSQKVVFTYTSSTITSTGAINTNDWNHIAVVREGTGTNQTKIYINGTNDGTGTVSTDFTQTEIMYIGANRTGGNAMKGFIDDLRVTKGVARYTANFTAPTQAFPLF